MKSSELVIGRDYVARNSKYDRKYRVRVLSVGKVMVEPANKFREAKYAKRVEVQIIENPYLDESFGSWNYRLTGNNGDKHANGEIIWIESRYIEQEWSAMERANQAANDAKLLSEQEADRVERLTIDAGIHEFVHRSVHWNSGHHKITMDLSQAQVERLAVHLLEGRNEVPS